MKNPFSKIRKSKKKTPELVSVQLTENQARTFLSTIQSLNKNNPSLVGVASKIAAQLGRIAHLRSVGLMEVLKK